MSGIDSGNHSRIWARKVFWGLGIIVVLGVVSWVVLRFTGGEESRRSPYRIGQVSDFLLELGAGPRGIDSINVPEGFEVEVAAGPDLVSYGVFFTFDDRGRLFLCESAGKNTSNQEALDQPSFRIRLLEDNDGDGVFDSVKTFADRITMALGVQWYRGSLYVAEPPDFVRYDDTDDDGVADHREVILTGWPLKANATTLHGPYLGPDGWMVLTYSPAAYKVQTKEGTLLEGPRGRVFRVKPDGTRLEWFVGGGFDNPVEVVFTSAGETLGTNTYFSDPKNGVRDSILHYVDGGIYPKWRPYVETAYQRTGEFMPAVTKFARVAPSGLALYRGGGFGPEYEGNLFSAQFNPHRVQRHILHRDGATFRTDDEDFLTSTDIDLHVTDVVQDADGSLLVLDTGAWYLHGCPVSRIAKPAFKGAIFRIRKTGARRIADPWGKNLKLETLPAARLAELLSDGRIPVRDQAVEHLVQAGADAVEPLIAVREGDAAPDVRSAAVFALGRIDNPSAAEGVRAALGDSALIVRVAAARMAGLNEDVEATDRLMEMVRTEEPAARRQAAEALGRIGEARAVPVLIEASANPEDRFVEHSIIYSLIRLGAEEPLNRALDHPNPRVRKAALIALDQMDGKPLRKEQLTALLDTQDEHLGGAVLWVVSHRPEWSGEVIEFLRARVQEKQFPTQDAEPIRRALLAFCADDGMQKMTAELLVGSPERQLFLLDAIGDCSLDDLPTLWIAQFQALVEDSDPRVRQKVLALVAARRIPDLDAKLKEIAANQAESADLRTAALGALVSYRPGLTTPGFQFLLGLLPVDTEADLRLTVAQVLSRAGLTTEQLLVVAREHLPGADPLILPTLLDAFRNAREEEVGRALVAGLLKTPEAVGGMAGERLRELLENFPSGVRREARPLLIQVEKEKESRAERLKELEPLLTAGGDVGRGRNVFFGKKGACSSCHTIGIEGGHVGPDLTAVGSVRSGIDILEAIVFPSASFVPGHEVYRVKTARETFSGVRGESAGDAVVLISGPRDRVRIPRSEIISMEPSTVSLMPDGFDENLTEQELIDMLAFLQAQKSRRIAAGSAS